VGEAFCFSFLDMARVVAGRVAGGFAWLIYLSISRNGVEWDADREVHATAGQEASATGSCVERQLGAKQKTHSLPMDKML